MRQIFLDTETTGLDPNQGHRIIEIAAIEFNNRQLTTNKFHSYINNCQVNNTSSLVRGVPSAQTRLSLSVKVIVFWSGDIIHFFANSGAI